MKWKLLSLFLGIFLLFLILYFSGTKEVIQTILHSNINFILLALAGFAISMLLRSLRWKILLKSVGMKISFSHAFYSLISALFLGNLVPFKSLEPVRGYFLKMKFKYPFSKTVPLVLTERVLDVFIFIFFSLITLQVIKNFLPYYILLFSFIGMLFFLFISLGILFIMNSKKLALKFFKLVSILPIIRRFKKKIENMSKLFSLGFDQLKKSNFLTPVLLLTFLIWIVEGIIFLLSAKAVGINLSYLLFGIPLLSILLGILTLIPGGLGSTEAIMILFLTSLGISTPQAASAVLIYRFFSYLIMNFIGMFTLYQVYGFDIFKKIMGGRKI